MRDLLYLLALLPAFVLQAAAVSSPPPPACSRDMVVKVAAGKLSQGVYAEKAYKQLKPMCKCLIEQEEKGKKAQYNKCAESIPWYLKKFPKDKLATACRCVDELCPSKSSTKSSSTTSKTTSKTSSKVSTTTHKSSTTTKKSSTSSTKKSSTSTNKSATSTQKPTTTRRTSTTTTPSSTTTKKSSSGTTRSSSKSSSGSSASSYKTSTSTPSTRITSTTQKSTGSSSSSASRSGSLVTSDRSLASTNTNSGTSGSSSSSTATISSITSSASGGSSSTISSSSSTGSSTGDSVSATISSSFTSAIEVDSSEPTPAYVAPKVESYDECLFDPTDSSQTFTLLDSADGVPYVNSNGVARKAQEVIDPIPEFHFVAPPNAPAGVFDAKMGDLFLAIQDNGQVIFTSSSSNGQKYITEGGKTFITTIYSLDCDGIMHFGFADAFPYEFGSIDDQGYLYARPDCPECAEALGITANVPSSSSTPTTTAVPVPRSIEKRWSFGLAAIKAFQIATQDPLADFNPLKFITVPQVGNRQQSGADPRCPNYPFGLVASVKPGARSPQVNGCGPDNGLKYLVPNFNFEGCCNNHDRCFDDCDAVFEDCNNSFRQCDLSACDSSFPRKPITIFGIDTGGDYNSVPRWGCKNVANFYGDAVGSFIGRDAFSSSTRDRCQCSCPSNTLECNGRCTPILNDANNCGGCGVKCASGVCNGNTCGCPDGQKLCNGRCINAYTDPNNCGGCGNVCSSGQCSNGGCVCGDGESRCGNKYGTCRDLMSNPTSCGTCGNFCPLGASCSGGHCVCPTGQITCGNACVDPGTDASNCGGCGTQCATGGLCSGASCKCPQGQDVCSNTCVDRDSDPDNCGSCGNSCASGLCSSGVCVPPPDDCKPQNFQNFGNILPTYESRDFDDFGPDADDNGFFTSNFKTDYSISDKVRCCSKCFLNEGGNCIFYAMNSNHCVWAIQTQASTKKSLPKPYPDQCPLGGASMTGYGPGQGNNAGYSAENGPCGPKY